MDELLTAVRTKITVVEETKAGQDESLTLPCRIESPEDAIQTLKGSPTWSQVQQVLTFLANSNNAGFNIKQPGASAAPLIQALVTRTLPDFWIDLKREKPRARTKLMFMNALLSVSGLGALLSRLKILTIACGSAAKPGETHVSPFQVRAVLELIEEILRPATIFSSVWSDCVLLGQTLPQRTILWREFVSLVASGKLISSFAEAEDVLKTSGERYKPQWVANGTEYTQWLAQNISHMIRMSNTKDAEIFSAARVMCSKTLALGYSGTRSNFRWVLTRG